MQPFWTLSIKRQKQKKSVLVSNAYEHCKTIRLAAPTNALLLFMTGPAECKTSKSRSPCSGGVSCQRRGARDEPQKENQRRRNVENCDFKASFSGSALFFKTSAVLFYVNVSFGTLPEEVP
ncbi:uncharacterized protein V6R79_006574 [Siganus canaliculatus]